MANWLIGLFAVLPILFSEKLIDPLVSIRYLFLSCFVLLFLFYFFFRNKKNISVSYPFQIIIVFVLGLVYAAWNVVSLTHALNPHEGFYVISRQLLNVVLLFLVMVTVIHEEKQIVKIGKALVLVSILQSFIGILQFYEVAFTTLPGNHPPYGLMANRNLFGSAQMLLLPFSLLIFLQGSRMWKFVALVSGIGIILSVFISQTRSAWLSSIVVSAVALSLALLFFPEKRKKIVVNSFAGMAVIAVLVVLFFASNTNKLFTESIKQRIVSLSQNSSPSNAEQSFQNRMDIWNKTIELIKKNPITGVGAGNWKIAVPALGSSGMAWETGKYVPDRPHSVYLHISSESGIPGALLYFGMWLMIVLSGFKVILKTTSYERKTVAILMLAVMAGFATDCIFSFPEERIEHLLYFTTACGIILGLFYNQFNHAVGKKNFFPKWLIPLLLLIAGFNIFIGIKKYAFELHANRAMAFDKAKLYSDVIKETEAAKNYFVSLDPNGKPVEVYSSIAYKAAKNYELALKEAATAQQYHPNSFMIYNNTGNIYSAMLQYDKAVENYEHALQLAPNSYNTLFNLAVNYFALQNYSACIETMNKIGWRKNEYLKRIYAECQRQLSK